LIDSVNEAESTIVVRRTVEEAFLPPHRLR